MGRVFASMSTSIDGYITGPNDRVEMPLGEGGDRLHEWLYDLESWRKPHGLEGGEVTTDGDLLDEAIQRTGAVVMGRRMFDFAEGPWGENPPFHVPVFVVTHRAREPLVKEGGTTFTFVTDGIEPALEQARAAAGDKDVSIGGGASVIQQYLRAGLLDEIHVTLVPVLLGGGKRLFDHLGETPIELERTQVVASSGVTHLQFTVVR